MILFPHRPKYLNMGMNTWEVTTIPRKPLLKLILRRRALILPSALLAVALPIFGPVQNTLISKRTDSPLLQAIGSFRK